MTEAEDFQDIDSSHIIISGVFNVFFSYTAIMLNVITIHALRKTSSLPQPLKTLLLSLAVSDLGVGLLSQPLDAARLVMTLKENTKNNPSYKVTDDVHTVTSVFLSCASFLGLTALAADRFLAIHLHLRYQEFVTQKRVVVVLTFIWLLSAILSPVWLWNRTIFSTISGGIATVCLIFTAFFYCKIYLAVRRHTNQIQVLQVQEVGQNGSLTNTARQIKSAVGTFYVYLMFLVCYLPHISIYPVYAIAGGSPHVNTLREYFLTLVYLNSSLNPLVYSWKMRHIRHAIMNILGNMFSSETTN